MKKSWLILLVFTILSMCVIPIASFAQGDEHEGKNVNLRVMSYNVHYGNGMDNTYNIDKIADAIRDSKAEVVGLQEVDVHWASRSLFEDDIVLLAQKLEMNYFFAPIYDLPPLKEGEPNRQFGVAVLSKYPILDAQNREITRLSTQVPNPTPAPAPGFAEVLLNVRGIKLKVYSTHLDYRSDPKIRSMQVQDMSNIIAENDNEKILLGDLNAKPEAPELAPLLSALNDTWADVHSEPGFTFPANKPDRRIDFILKTPAIQTISSEIINTLASDHRPIIADVKIPRSKKE